MREVADAEVWFQLCKLPTGEEHDCVTPCLLARAARYIRCGYAHAGDGANIIEAESVALVRIDPVRDVVSIRIGREEIEQRDQLLRSRQLIQIDGRLFLVANARALRRVHQAKRGGDSERRGDQQDELDVPVRLSRKLHFRAALLRADGEFGAGNLHCDVMPPWSMLRRCSTRCCP